MTGVLDAARERRRGFCSVCNGPVRLDAYRQWGHTERDDYGHRVVLARPSS